ncbi:siderophore-interacting protein [Streptomyces sp. ICBB 8177]|uniref:siderophore-interacting protein n=1 Tax=Streptomyces sp. ICBB 8177 TaxID=563922 RepID=UPI000D682C43|nr:siderophore-interacting protein [Streptomyces sp. ICBB 8177]PWI42758.1 NADPH-dependent ferric siderophore reductase [Streptomyces sp. ICBB 8177]
MAVSATATPLRAAFRLFPVRVERTRRLTPHMVRVTFAGPSLDGFHNGGYDQRGKVLLPRPGQREPVTPPDADTLGWYEAWKRMPAEDRPVMRTYTIRAQRAEQAEVDIDFALHGTLGPASRWAAECAPGDRVLLCGPARPGAGGVDFQPPAGTGQVLLAGDETALPAVAAILDALPASLPVRVFVEVAGPREEQPLSRAADVRWLHRHHGSPGLLEAVRGAELPLDAQPYAWLAGEASAIRELRRHLVGERGLDKRSVCFKGYWRAGLTEDDA